MEKQQLGELLDSLHDRYNNEEFIADDPVSIPHSFSQQEDIEISGFLVSTIAWGNRKAIVRSGRRMMGFMDDSPHDFVLNASEEELLNLEKYVHRTFNGGDMITFVKALRRFYTEHGGLGDFFEGAYRETNDMRVVLSRFRHEFFMCDHLPRTRKHISSIDKKAACKRLNMYLRWMVRRDGRGVDFGLWQRIPMSALYLPLDVHSGNVSRELGLLNRKQNDWKAVEEITEALRGFDTEDPVKYDYALFGAGVSGFFRE